jgi:hypothetical protein
MTFCSKLKVLNNQLPILCLQYISLLVIYVYTLKQKLSHHNFYVAINFPCHQYDINCLDLLPKSQLEKIIIIISLRVPCTLRCNNSSQRFSGTDAVMNITTCIVVTIYNG